LCGESTSSNKELFWIANLKGRKHKDVMVTVASCTRRLISLVGHNLYIPVTKHGTTAARLQHTASAPFVLSLILGTARLENLFQ
jgi:hypothetical protein